MDAVKIAKGIGKSIIFGVLMSFVALIAVTTTAAWLVPKDSWIKDTLFVAFNTIFVFMIFASLNIGTYKLTSILYKECNPGLYNQVYENISFKMLFDVQSYLKVAGLFFIGDYRNAINILESKKTLAKANMYGLQSLYIQSLFMLKNYNKIKTAYEGFRAYKEKKFLYPSVNQRKTEEFKRMEAIYYYANGEHEKALEVCKSFIEPPKELLILTFYNKFYTALCYEALGENEKSQGIFKEICENGYPLALTKEAKKRLVNTNK